MEIEYECSAVKYDPGEGLKLNASIILDFDVDLRSLRGFIHGLTPLNLCLPLESIKHIDNHIGIIDRYWVDMTSRIEIKIVDRLNYIIMFTKGSLNGQITESNLADLGLEGVEEFFKGNITRSALFTNFLYGSKNKTKTEAYLITIDNVIT